MRRASCTPARGPSPGGIGLGPADTAVALVLTVTGAAALAAVGPQMPDLFTAGNDLVFVPVAVAMGGAGGQAPPDAAARVVES